MRRERRQELPTRFPKGKAGQRRHRQQAKCLMVRPGQKQAFQEQRAAGQGPREPKSRRRDGRRWRLEHGFLKGMDRCAAAQVVDGKHGQRMCWWWKRRGGIGGGIVGPGYGAIEYEFFHRVFWCGYRTCICRKDLNFLFKIFYFFLFF